MFFVEATNYFDEHTSSVAKIAASGGAVFSMKFIKSIVSLM